ILRVFSIEYLGPSGQQNSHQPVPRFGLVAQFQRALTESKADIRVVHVPATPECQLHRRTTVIMVAQEVVAVGASTEDLQGALPISFRLRDKRHGFPESRQGLGIFLVIEETLSFLEKPGYLAVEAVRERIGHLLSSSSANALAQPPAGRGSLEPCDAVLPRR